MKTGMIFIDGSNVFFDWNHVASGKQMDIQKYIDVIKSKYPDIDFKRTYYFTSDTGTNGAFLQQINKLPYVEVKCGRLQNKTINLSKYGVVCSSCGTPIAQTITMQTDKGTDVNIAVEMLKHGFHHSYDLAVLASRDADFVGVVRILKDLGINVELALFQGVKNNAQELSEHVDKVMIIDSSEYIDCEKTTATP